VNNATGLRRKISHAYSRASRLFKVYVLRDRFERAAAAWFRDHGDETLRLDYPLDRNSVVFDCGGFEGDWAAAIHERYGCRVFVFEPVKLFLQGIEARFRGNKSVRALGFGLHSRDENMTIHLAGNASSVFGEAGSGELIQLREVAGVLRELSVTRIDLMKINIEGGEFDLLERLLQTRLIEAVTHLQVQFHRFVPDAVDRRRRIREGLAATHQLTYDYEFIWESWSRKGTAQDATGKAMER